MEANKGQNNTKSNLQKKPFEEFYPIKKMHTKKICKIYSSEQTKL